MGLIRIPGPDFKNLAELLEIIAISGFQDEGFFTLDLGRVWQSSRIQITTYAARRTPAATETAVLQWRDASDFNQIIINGQQGTVADERLPPTDHTRIITRVALDIGGTAADYTSAQALRQSPLTTTQYTLMAAFGAVGTSDIGVAPTINLLPQWLDPLEHSISLRSVVSGANALINYTFTMVSAPPGVIYGGPGV